MKVAVLSESGADEAAIRILVEGLLGKETQRPAMPPSRGRGWGAVLRDVPMLLRHLHFHTDAEALVLVLDSDLSPVHGQAHNRPGGANRKCRLCRMKATVAEVQSQLRPRQGRPPIRTALGLAVPQIEAWYLMGRDRHVNEASWIGGQESGRFPYPRETLKAKVYGTGRPSLELETRRATEEAQRIVCEGKLARLEEIFPGGFGALANDVRGW